MKPLLIFVIACGLCSLAVQSMAQGNSHPSKGKPVVVIEPDFVTLPGGIDGQWNAARVVVIARVVKSKQSKRVDGPGAVLPNAVHTLEVEEVFKTDGSVDRGSEIEVVQDAGTVEEADRVVTIPSRVFETFKPGCRYALFLAPHEGRYLLITGPDSVLALGEGRAVTQGTLPSLSESDLVAKLRQLVSR